MWCCNSGKAAKQAGRQLREELRGPEVGAVGAGWWVVGGGCIGGVSDAWPDTLPSARPYQSCT